MIKQYVLSRVCLKCQGCCRFAQIDTIWSPCLLNEEIQELLKNKIPPSVITYNKKIRLEPFGKQGNSNTVLPKGAVFICPFLNTQDNICKIYSYRPFECQLYPFLINRKGKKVFLAVDLKCPFVKDNSKTKGLKVYTQYLIDYLNNPQGLNILRNNPQIIQQYSEFSNLAELKI